jgi:uncharacterized protein YyaL (SSP411 family)
VEQGPFGYPQMLLAMDFALGPTQEVVVAGDPDAPSTQALIRTVRRQWLPRAVVALHPAAGPQREAIEALAPYTKAQDPVRGAPAAYVCEHYACRLPVTDPTQLAALLTQERTEGNRQP